VVVDIDNAAEKRDDSHTPGPDIAVDLGGGGIVDKVQVRYTHEGPTR